MFCQKLIATQNYLLVCVMHSVFDYLLTRKYMHAETLADKTIVFSEREVFKVVVMVTQ